LKIKYNKKNGRVIQKTIIKTGMPKPINRINLKVVILANEGLLKDNMSINSS
jgi:hypothetical protein